MSDFSERRVMMVDTQVRPSDVTKFPIIAAMLDVPRERFVPAGKKDAAYLGDNLALGAGRVLLDPRSLAKMLDTAAILPSELVLYLGGNLGYGPTVMARLAQAVVALEEDEEMAREATATLSDLQVDNVLVEHGNLQDGASSHGPYDVIFVEGGVEAVPDALLTQLKDGGRIVALFMEGVLGEVQVGYKSDDMISWRRVFNATAPVLPGFAKKSQFEL